MVIEDYGCSQLIDPSDKRTTLGAGSNRYPRCSTGARTKQRSAEESPTRETGLIRPLCGTCVCAPPH